MNIWGLVLIEQTITSPINSYYFRKIEPHWEHLGLVEREKTLINLLVLKITLLEYDKNYLSC